MKHSHECRALYARADLVRLINPGSIAVVGASERPGAFGNRAMGNLKTFSGEVWPVNARYETVHGMQCYASLEDLPGAPDLVIVAVAQNAVEDVVRSAAAIGAGGAVIFASGYAETGRAELKADQFRLGEIARQGGLRILGPNCAGFINFTSSLGAAFSSSLNMRYTGAPAVGLVSQSGALGFSLSQAVEHGTAFSHMLSVGNSCDVDVADLVSYLSEEPSCQAIACLYEGLNEPARLLRAVEKARSAGKPVIIYKLATGTEGAESALSHTGVLAGSARVQRAVFEKAGAVWAESWNAFVECSSFLANAPEPSGGGGGTGVLTTSGGAAIMASDIVEMRGESLCQPNDATTRILVDRLPEFATARNPLDITAQVLNDPECLRACMDAMLSDDTYDALVIAQTRATDYVKDRVKVFGELSRRHKKPVCIVWLTQWLEGPGAQEAEDEPGVAVFRSMENCFEALHAWRRRAAIVKRKSAPRQSAPGARRDAATVLNAASGRVVAEFDAKRALAPYGLPVAREALVQDEEAAIASAAEIGIPVALKLVSKDLPHKTDAGVVRLSLAGEDAVRKGFREILEAKAKLDPSLRMDGILVQAMAEPGLEFVVGMHTDAAFGPVVVVGLGGVFVELLGDTANAPAPVTKWEVLDMLQSLKSRKLFEGFRGASAVDLDTIADIVVRLSEFADDHRDEIAEIDLNPVICNVNGATIVDALIVRHPD